MGVEIFFQESGETMNKDAQIAELKVTVERQENLIGRQKAIIRQLEQGVHPKRAKKQYDPAPPDAACDICAYEANCGGTEVCGCWEKPCEE